MHKLRPRWRRSVTLLLLVSLQFGSPAFSFAQTATDANGNPTGPTETTGAPECTGAGCNQGVNQGEGQGADQGANQGGPTPGELGATQDENGNWVFPEGAANTSQGAQQGQGQGTSNGVAATNSQTGANSTNSTGVNATDSTSTNVNNNATTSTTAGALGNTGGNTQNMNTGTGGIGTGNAGIGVTQVTNDNTAVIGGSAGLTTQAHNGDYNGDLNLGFGAGTANLAGEGGLTSVRATNETTGSNSDNTIDLLHRLEEFTEVQNDGRIDTNLNLAAVTGQNEASMNTGNGTVTTGNANVAATLVNLLNTTVINGDIWITVADIFGDLNGNINIPDLTAFLSAAAAQGLLVDASNAGTGQNSTNDINVNIDDQETTRITNDATVTTNVDADAITGQNDALSNTGGSLIDTGDASVTASNVTLANTTIEGGNWGLFIVNALNGWLGFLVGDNGEVRALSQDETLRQIEAANQQTGSDSTNTINVTDETDRTTIVDNNAIINNNIIAAAITGQNDTNYNTGQGQITTGDASVQASAVNIANTTVKDGSLFIAVVNIFGDWFGDLFYAGSSLAQTAATQEIGIVANNSDTGAGSTNDVDVDVNREHDTTITNDADLRFNVDATIDTGNNRANKNTQGATIATGNGWLGVHSRTVANATGIAAGDSGLVVSMDSANENTGFDSTNRIRANINDDRVIDITNNANVSTLLASLVNTGFNEANQNTLGAHISTGNIDAAVAIQNLVNRVIVALANEGVAVDATFVNQLTGALSENLNDLTAARNVLVGVANDALIDTILNLVFNTGGNTANENTGGGSFSGASVGGNGTSITTGQICVNGQLENNANAVSLTGSVSSDITNNAHVTNDANVQATTGNNQQNRNTMGGTSGPTDPCRLLAQTPEEQPEQPPVGGGTVDDRHSDDGDQGNGGGDDESVVEVIGRVAAAVVNKPRVSGGHILKRFPVAGSNGFATWTPSTSASPWTYLLIATLGVMGAAWYLDQKAVRQPRAKLVTA